MRVPIVYLIAHFTITFSPWKPCSNEVRKQTQCAFSTSFTWHVTLRYATWLAQLWELQMSSLSAPKSCQVVHNEHAEKPHQTESRDFIFSLLITKPFKIKPKQKIHRHLTSSWSRYFTSDTVTCGCNSILTILKNILIFSISLTKVEGLINKSEATSFKEQH